MSLRQNLFCILACSLGQLAVAETSKIAGAFGYQFGETLADEAEADCNDDGHCFVTPETPYYAFTSYQVYLTESKRRIYEIIGLGKPDSIFKCNAQAENIARILEKKYDIEFEVSEYEAPNGMLMNTWKVTIGTRPTGIWSLDREVTDTTKSVVVLCHDYSSMEGWKAGGLLNLFPVTITIHYKSNAVISTENLELIIDERGL